LTLLAAMVTLALVVFAPAAFGQPVEAKINEDVWSNAEKGKADAKAGGTESKAQPCPEGAAAKSGDITAKAPCPPKAPPPPPKAAAAPAAPKELPKTGGMGSASLLGLGAGALLVGGGLLARRFVR
jgi:LPXTG-motif cell wall-anchored protein